MALKFLLGAAAVKKQLGDGAVVIQKLNQAIGLNGFWIDAGIKTSRAHRLLDHIPNRNRLGLQPGYSLLVFQLYREPK